MRQTIFEGGDMKHESFIVEVRKAYGILRKLHEDGEVNITQDASLVRMINFIDDELGIR